MKVTQEDYRKTSSSSKGDQNKWLKDGYWFKENKFGYEDISEYLASKVLQHSTLEPHEYVNYGLCWVEKEKGVLVKGCYSEDFTKNDQTILTLARLLETLQYQTRGRVWKNGTPLEKMTEVIDAVHKATDYDMTDYLRKVFTLDALILNEDRHLNNIAFLYNGGSELDTAPIFDNGLSLLSDINDYKTGVGITTSINRVKSKPFSTSFSKQMKALGVGFKVNYNTLMEELEPHREELGRAYSVLRFQLNKYKGIIVE